MRKPIIAGNWKMHKNVEDIEQFLNQFKDLVQDNQGTEIVVCVPFTGLYTAGKAMAGSNISLGAQNMYPASQGAFTGEVSPEMLIDLGVSHVIIGHSERREILGERDQFIQAKVQKALEVELTPILCVGETLEEREQGLTQEKCRIQVTKALEGINSNEVEKVIIAYEPIWAIGTGKNASPQDAEETIAYIRGVLSQLYSEDVGQKVRIQYGGSVKADNIKELMNMKNIDGALVGGASLDPISFAKIVNYGE